MSVVVCLACITAKSNRLPERVLNFLFLLAAVLPLMWVWMWAFGLDPDYSFLTPFWYSWFLMSMAWWMITVPFIERFPRTMLVASLGDRKSTRLNSSHVAISYAVFCLKNKQKMI